MRMEKPKHLEEEREEIKKQRKKKEGSRKNE